jgi:crotonobetainyl-CoA:carnitine CoA-transferase CaiB-like acyl-CoA transferase
MTAPLQGIRVVELTTVLLGPWAAQMMGDLGADVIKIETPAGDTTRQLGPRRNPDMGALFLTINRNKRSVVLDLTRPEAREALARIVDTADVFLHNLRPRVAAKLGIDHASFSSRNPRLIYCATYGFGREGPLADKPAYDDVIQAASGIAHLHTDTLGEPRYVPTVLADKTTAYAVFSAILVALLQRSCDGLGQEIEVPMYETMVEFALVEHLYGAAFDPPEGAMGYARLLTPQRRPYRTLDGQHLAVMPYTDENWRALFLLAGRAELCADERFLTIADRVRHAAALYGVLGELIGHRSADDWLRDLDSAGVPVMKVSAKESLLDDPQLQASGFWRFVDHPTEGRLRMMAPPTRYSRTRQEVRRMPPRLGQHSAEVLAEAGYGPQDIEALFAGGASASER